jgi:hypothetical protein
MGHKEVVQMLLEREDIKINEKNNVRMILIV